MKNWMLIVGCVVLALVFTWCRTGGTLKKDCPECKECPELPWDAFEEEKVLLERQLDDVKAATAEEIKLLRKMVADEKAKADEKIAIIRSEYEAKLMKVEVDTGGVSSYEFGLCMNMMKSYKEAKNVSDALSVRLSEENRGLISKLKAAESLNDHFLDAPVPEEPELPTLETPTFSKNAIYVNTAFVNNDLFYGLGYGRSVSRRFSVQGGILYSKSKNVALHGGLRLSF